MPTILRLQLLGPFKAELNQGGGLSPLPPLPTRQSRALLARLALAHPEPLPRFRLAADLFPHVEVERGAHSLRTSLYYLRRAIPGLVCASETRVWLDPALTVELDVSRFEAASQPSASRSTLEEAARLYHGPFLESAPEGWAEAEARRLRDRYIDVLRTLVAFSQASGSPGEGLDAARRWINEEPWSIQAHYALISAHASLGDYRLAEAQVARARQVLSSEWGRVTDEAFEALARRVRALAAARPGKVEGTASQPPVPGGSKTSPPGLSGQAAAPKIDFDHLPLVGRAAEFGQLWDAWIGVLQGRPGQSRVMILEGPAGIGKTRLANELAARVRAQNGALVLRGMANETTAFTPLGLLRAAFASLSETDCAQLQEACSGLDDMIRGLLCWIIPELEHVLIGPCMESQSSVGNPRRADAFPKLDGPGEMARRQAALSALEQALTASGPILLVLENAHQADAETLALLKDNLAASRCCLVVLTAQPRYAAPKPDWQTIRLEPLAEHAVRELINQVFGSTRPGDQAALALENIASRSAGNPQFACEMLRVLAEQGRLTWDSASGWQLSPASFPLPEEVAGLLSQRLASLSAPALWLAKMLAVLGRPAEKALLSRLCESAALQSPPARGIPAAGQSAQAELLGRQVLVVQGGRLWFGHDWLRETLNASLDSATLLALHRQVALALGGQNGLDRAERMMHYQEAGAWEPALEDALAAGETVLAGQNLPQVENALRVARKALERLAPPPGDPRRWRFLRLSELYHSQAEHGPAWQRDLDDLLTFAEAAGEEAWQVEAFIRKTRGLYALNAFDEAVQVGRKAALAAHNAGLPGPEAEARELLVSILLDQGRMEEVWPECEALLAAAQASADERMQALALNGLVHINMSMGKMDEAIALFTRLAEHPYVQKRSDWDVLRQMAIFSMAGRAYEAGLAWLRASVQRAQAVGDVIGMVHSQAYLCFELVNLGRYAEAHTIGDSVMPLAGQLKEAYQEGFLCYSLAKVCLHVQKDLAQALELVEHGIDRTGSAGLVEPLTGLLGLEAQICMTRGWSARAQVAVERIEALAGPAPVVCADHIAAQVWLALGQPEKARRAAHRAAEHARDLGFLAVWADEMLWIAAQVLEQVEGNGLPREIRQRAFHRFVDDLTRMAGPDARRLFIQANPDHQSLARMPADGPIQIIWLPEPGAPTGRPLRPDELAPVVWNRDAPGEPDLGSPAGRRARLERLCQSALDQGAVATLETLADFLSVSTRTLQRDLQALRQSGVKAQTRGGLRNK